MKLSKNINMNRSEITTINSMYVTFQDIDISGDCTKKGTMILV